MRTPTAALLLLALLAPTIAVAQADCNYKPVPRGWAIAGEAAGATLVGYGLSGVVLLAFYMTSYNDPSAGIVGVPATGAALCGGCALGAWGAGTMMHQGGSFWPSLLGAGCGTLAGGLVGLGAALLPKPFNYAGFAICATLPPAGAVIGYNMGRPADASYGGFEQRLEMPRVAMTMTHDGLNRPVPGVRCDLVALRF